VLPVGSGVGELERRLGKAGLGGIVSDLKPETVMLTLPRFHLHTEAELRETARIPGHDDPVHRIGRLFPASPRRPSLIIGAIEHVADINVDEEGTEAGGDHRRGYWSRPPER